MNTTFATDNIALALRLAGPDPAAWLARADGGANGTYRALLAHGRYVEATLFLLHHLKTTEHTRGKLDTPTADDTPVPVFGAGPAPTWDEACDTFRCAADRQQPAQIATIKHLLRRLHEAAS